ncbi:MAG: histidine kinase [Actinomycetota bacterium]
MRLAYGEVMFELLTDRRDFRTAVLIVALGFAIWSLAVSVDWGWIPASFVLLVLLVELVTDRVPDPLLLTLVTVPTAVAESQDKGNVGWFVAVLVLAVVASADPIRSVTKMVMAVTVLSPLVLWAARVEDYVELGPWTWLAGLALGVIFGLVIGLLNRAIGELEESRALLAESTAREERQRIARELHDVVGHSFSVVLLHLAGARTTLSRDPEQAAAALADAEEVGRKGMNDLREALALVRADEGRRRPVESLDGLEPLVEQYRRAGLDVSLERTGPVGEVATGVGIVAYEVVRESLTNVAKHAPHQAVGVELAVSGDELEVSVVNPLPEVVAGTQPGAGLDGMRDRVLSIGGRFSARADGDRWRVHARLPVSAVDTDDRAGVRA